MRNCNYNNSLIQPDGQGKYSDLIDLAIQSSSKTVKTKNKDGTYDYTQVIDDDTLWFKTLLVNSNTFSRAALRLMDWERMGENAKYNMSKERAEQWFKEVIAVSVGFRRAFDAKSSESQRDKLNSQSTYIDKINKNKVERVYTTKGDKVKGGIMDSILGRDKEKDMENDD